MTRLTCHLMTAPGTGWGRITRDPDVARRMLAALGSPGPREAGRFPVLTITYRYDSDRQHKLLDTFKGEGVE